MIDEISMISGRTFDYLNYHLKRMRWKQEPFGGIQVIVIGDFMQLPPVRTDDSEPYDWVFKSEAWQEAGFKVISLEKNWRQAGDAAFINALSGVRQGKLDRDQAEILMERVKPNPPSDMPRLMTHNLAVDKWNAAMLSELPGEVWLSEAHWVYDNDRQKGELEAVAKAMLTPQKLELKVGALVMFTANNGENGTYNGQLGKVKELPEDEKKPWITVTTKESGDVLVGKRQFKFDYDKERPRIEQFPLRLAYAMTIHKSQGITLDCAYADVRAAREPGQCYVALSRVRTLGGLRLKAWPKGICVSNEAQKFYEEVRI